VGRQKEDYRRRYHRTIQGLQSDHLTALHGGRRHEREPAKEKGRRRGEVRFLWKNDPAGKDDLFKNATTSRI